MCCWSFLLRIIHRWNINSGLFTALDEVIHSHLNVVLLFVCYFGRACVFNICVYVSRSVEFISLIHVHAWINEMCSCQCITRMYSSACQMQLCISWMQENSIVEFNFSVYMSCSQNSTKKFNWYILISGDQVANKCNLGLRLGEMSFFLKGRTYVYMMFSWFKWTSTVSLWH
jgi:hypothetical protein